MIVDKFKISSLEWNSDENLLCQLKERVLNKNVTFKYSKEGVPIDGIVKNVEIRDNGNNYKYIVFDLYDGTENFNYTLSTRENILVHDYNLL